MRNIKYEIIWSVKVGAVVYWQLKVITSKTLYSDLFTITVPILSGYQV
jgi:hypothetical protein